MSDRSHRGALAHHGGLAAETQVLEHYRARGASLVARRWRGRGGEIDLVMREADTLVFVEVKRAASHARAAERLGERQIARLLAAAEEFLASEPGGAASETRIDVALVDGTGGIEILRNALL